MLYNTQFDGSKPESAVMRRIKAAAADAGSPLDEPIEESSHIVPVTSAVRRPGLRSLYLDVPLRAIVALGNKNFVLEGRPSRTWRDLLACLHGTAWDDDVLAYLESELGENSLPVEDAARPLTLEVTGGLVAVVNGMHRATAAIAWLAATRGENAVLRKVKADVYEAQPNLRHRILDAIQVGHDVAIGSAQSRGEYWLRVGSLDNRDGAKFFRLRGDRAFAHPDSRPAALARVARLGGCIGRLPGVRWSGGNECRNVEWVSVTPRLAAALENDGWMREQLTIPRYEPVSTSA